MYSWPLLHFAAGIHRNRKRKTMKKILCLLAAVLCLALCACGGSSHAEEQGGELYLCVENTVTDRVLSLAVTGYLGNNTFGSTGVTTADQSAMKADTVSFCLKKADLPADADLAHFGVQFTVTDMEGVAHPLEAVFFPVEFGKDYFFRLRLVDGKYSLWSQQEDACYATEMSQPAPAAAEPGEEALYTNLLNRYITAAREDWTPEKCIQVHTEADMDSAIHLNLRPLGEA